MKNAVKIASIGLIILLSIRASAQLKLPKVIGDNMVLQCQQVVPVWGWANKDAAVKLQFAGQQKTVKANQDGYWRIYLSPMRPSAVPAQMLISSGDQTLTLNNILVGEVWLCSGQSNMEYPMKNSYSQKPPFRGADSAALELTVSNPQIRLFKVEKKLGEPDVVTKGWQESGGAALEAFSAAGYFFAKNLNARLKVPIGMIATAWGGTQIEPWTPLSGYLDDAAFKNEITGNPPKLNGQEPGKIYNSMVLPLAPYAIKGVLWYQGESNVITHDSLHYADKMRALAQSWRKAWGIKKLPLYYVALAPHTYTHRKDALKHSAETLPAVWEAQTAALAVPYTEMVPTTDLVDILSDIHPSYKWEVGRRLANLALTEQYGYQKLEYTGPRYKSMHVDGDKITLNFTHADGLTTSDGKAPDWIMIAGADGQFKPAQAEIKNNKLIIWNTEIPNPQQVRYGWNEVAQPNLVNSSGLPVMPFRTR